jgi:hypothetical protein
MISLSDLFAFLFVAGPLSMIVAFLAALVFVRGRHILSAWAIGLIAFMPGCAIGIGAFCFGPDAGNLCGLGGVLGTGPFGFAAGALAYIVVRRRSNRGGSPAP